MEQLRCCYQPSFHHHNNHSNRIRRCPFQQQQQHKSPLQKIQHNRHSKSHCMGLPMVRVNIIIMIVVVAVVPIQIRNMIHWKIHRVSIAYHPDEPTYHRTIPQPQQQRRFIMTPITRLPQHHQNHCQSRTFSRISFTPRSM